MMLMPIRLVMIIAIAAGFFLRAPVVPSSAAGKTVCIDPGHGGTAATDTFRVGALGEREEWINLRVAQSLRKLLEAKGAHVIMTRTADDRVELAARGELALMNRADLFVSIHHNATADSSVNFPIVYYHGAASENQASVEAARLLATELKSQLFSGAGHTSVVSDYTIFPKKGAAVLRSSYGVPGLLAEASFFSNAAEEARLKKEEHNEKEAMAFMSAIERFFVTKPSSVKEKKIPLELPVFSVLQEAERMKPEALLWLSDFETGKEFYAKKDTASLRMAYDMFTRSARSFPDSWVARECHVYRSAILSALGKKEQAKQEAIRAREFYTIE